MTKVMVVMLGVVFGCTGCVRYGMDLSPATSEVAAGRGRQEIESHLDGVSVQGTNVGSPTEIMDAGLRSRRAYAFDADRRLVLRRDLAARDQWDHWMYEQCLADPTPEWCVDAAREARNAPRYDLAMGRFGGWGYGAPVVQIGSPYRTRWRVTQPPDPNVGDRDEDMPAYEEPAEEGGAQ